MKKFLKFKRTESGTKLCKSKFMSKKDRKEINKFLENKEYADMTFKLGRIFTIKNSFKSKFLKKNEIITQSKLNKFLLLDEAHSFLPKESFAGFFENTRGKGHKPTVITQSMDDLKPS